MTRLMIRRAAWALGIVMVVVAALIAGGLAFLQTEAGGRSAARALSRLASTPGESELAIGRIEPGLPRRLGASGITMRDQDGQWLAIDHVEIAWSPLALLRGQLHIARATARGVHLDRLPETEPSADDGSGLSLPSLPVALRLDRLAVDEVEIGAALAGETVTLRAGGRLAAETDGRARTDIALTRTNGVGGEANLAVIWDPAEATLDVAARLDEPRGGVLGRALGLADRPPASIAVVGRGPLEAWDGRADIALGEAAGLSARIRSEQAERVGRTVVHVSGRADVAALLDDKVRTLVENGVEFSVALARLPGGSLRTVDLDVSTAAVRLNAAGTIDLEAGRFDDTFHLSLDADDPAALAPLIAPFRVTAITASANLSGALDRPRIDALGRIQGLAGEGFAVREANWTAGIVHKAGRFVVNATAAIAGLSAGGTDIDALAGDALRLSLTGSLDRAGESFDLAGLKLTAPAASLNGAGTLDLAGGGFTGTIEATLPDLAAFAHLAGPEVAGPDVAGRVHLRAEIDSAEGRPRADIAIDSDGVRTGIAAADVLLGTAPSARAKASLAADGTMRVEHFAVDGAGMHLKAEATVREGAIGAVYRAHVGDVAPAATAAGMALRGALSLDGTASGQLADPNVNAAVLLADGGFANLAIASARVDLKAEQLSSHPRGTITAVASLDQGSIRARTPFARDGEMMRLGPFSASGLGVTASGELAVPLDRRPMRGSLTVRYTGGDEPAALAGYRLRGSANADVRLGAAEGEQAVDFTIGGHALALDTADGTLAGADALAVRGSLTGLATRSAAGSEDRLRGDVRLSAERLVFGGTTLAGLQGRVSGTGKAADVQLTARAPAGLAGKVRTRGTLASRDGGIEVVVTAIEGRPGGHPLALRRPLTLLIADGGVAVSGLDLAVDGGEVSGAFRTGAEGTDGELRLRRLPLSLVAAVRPDLPLSGTLDGDGSVRTEGSSLVGNLRLALAQVTMSRHGDAQVFAVTATVALQAAGAAAELRIDGLGRPLLASARVPARIDARSFAVQLPPSAPLAGRLTWTGPVDRLWELLPLPDQRLTGEAQVDFTLGGRVDSPRIEGALTLSHATYEHFLTGTVINNLELTASAPGGGALRVELSGNDGATGRISGRGTAILGAGLQPTADIEIAFEEATLVRRDDITAMLSGTITFRETAEGARLAGAIVTNRMEIRLVDRLPPSVVELDVTEINFPPGRTPPTGQSSEQMGEKASPWAATLDIRADMPRRVFVRGRGLESEWQGNVAVSGTTAEPVVIGSVRTLSGVFDFAGKRFTLEKGDIGFTGGKKINPTISLEAVRRTEDITAIIAVTGTAQDPEIELRSRPSLPDSEILSRVLFDKEVSKLGPVEAAQLGLALDTLASGESMSDDALSYVRNLLGVDVLTVDPGSGGGGGPTLGVGRYVGEGLYVGAKQGAEADSTAGTVELEVLPGLSIESELGQDEAGASGALGLRWKWDY